MHFVFVEVLKTGSHFVVIEMSRYRFVYGWRPYVEIRHVCVNIAGTARRSDLKNVNHWNVHVILNKHLEHLCIVTHFVATHVCTKFDWVRIVADDASAPQSIFLYLSISADWPLPSGWLLMTWCQLGTRRSATSMLTHYNITWLVLHNIHIGYGDVIKRWWLLKSGILRTILKGFL